MSNGSEIMRSTGATDRDGSDVLKLDWPEPLVPMRQIGEHAPWLPQGSGLVLAFAPPRLIDVATLVTSQENACRFCYGALRAAMRISGYSEAQIRDLEREVELADGVTREVVRLARKLARSDPRPVRAELSALERLGLDPRAIAEIVFVIATTCFSNRVGTFLALPPDRGVERFAESWIGRLIGKLLIEMSGKKTRRSAPRDPVEARGSLAPLFRQLPESPVTAWFAGLVEQVFAPRALERRTKVLILAVVARTMGCRFCEEAARTELEELGLPSEAFQRILATLSGPEISPLEKRLLDWARETVHYQTGAIQKRTRSLASEVDVGALLEGVSAAAVSNTAVRMAMLVE